MSDFDGTTFGNNYYQDGIDNGFPNNPIFPQGGNHPVPRDGATMYPQALGTEHMHQVDTFLGGNGLGSNMAATATLVADTLAGTVPPGDVNAIVNYTSQTHSRMEFIDQNTVRIGIGTPQQWDYHAPTPWIIPPAPAMNVSGTEASLGDWLTVLQATAALAGGYGAVAARTSTAVYSAISAVVGGAASVTNNPGAFARVGNDIGHGMTNYQIGVNEGIIVPFIN